MKKYGFYLIVIFAIFQSSLKAQHGQAVYAELLGNGLIFSFNYDTRFTAAPNGIGGRIGLGYVGSPKEGGVALIPFQLNWLLGRNDRYFELGIGATIVTGSRTIFDENFNHVVGTMTFGYRHQPADGGFMWKIALTPVLADGFFWPYFGGIALGYCF